MVHFIGPPLAEVVRRWRREPRTVPLVRAELRSALGEWRLAELEENALIVVSELVTNAVRHAVGPRDREVETRFLRLPDGLAIEVHDAGDGWPEIGPPAAEGEGGRGLHLVAALAHRWAVEERCGPGKRVWAHLSVRPRRG
ncbi:ATP-binding protein [Streptomyces subrutilus]|uniref:ATP-binding protein n=1 Tax=Streptomyces subrutilus TaxID=36818 RepID=A0A5P2UTW3_9ACTN|nr:ATP-binding protein [Streptomyces subrutilus]QEU80157.1 ATP-binding protein [Streptomyces subrutilus]GGZ50143.1 ATP-binding protein [Streptomyces subrutilus]